MIFKKDNTQYNSHIFSRVPRAHEKKMRVWHVLTAHGEVFCSHPPKISQAVFGLLMLPLLRFEYMCRQYLRVRLSVHNFPTSNW